MPDIRFPTDGCDDPFAYFYEKSELETQAEAILEREQHKTPAPPEGGRYPFIQLDGCSEAEKATMKKYLQQKQEQAQQRVANQAAPKAEMPPSCFGLASPFGMVRELGAILRGERKKSQEPNAYDAMMMVLSQIRIVNWEGAFYYLKGSVYQKVDEQGLRTRIFSILEPLIAAGKNIKIINIVMDMLRMYPNIRATRSEDHGDLVFFLNGCYSISRREFSLTPLNVFFTVYIPIEHMPGASDCPYFDAFLQQISGGDERIIRLIWEMIGYLLSPDLEVKGFFVLLGVGNTGKSVLGNLIASLFNPEAISNIDIYRFRDKFAPAELRGKRLNISMDLPRTRLSREAIGVIKQITGDDTIATEQKFKAIESQKPTCKLLFGSNFPLMPADNDEAFCKRVVTIPFRYPVPPERQDKHLLDKLMGERQAIVIKALAALLDLRARNYQFIQVDQGVGLNGYISEFDLLEAFLDNCCVFDPSAFTFTADLLEAYNAYRTSRNMPPLDNSAAFSRDLNRFCAGRIKGGRVRRDGKNQNGYYGIKVMKFVEGGANYVQ